jgi:hypothetical protein
LGFAGCGTTQSQLATQQLLLSDAVDRAVAKLDMEPLAGKKVYLDEKYALNIKGIGFVNSEYILSAVRQQMLSAGCMLEQSAETAEYVVEVRIGALGTDGHDVTFGIPKNNSVNSVVSALPNAPNVPSLPEISLARRDDQLGAAKVALYAYERASRKPVWQSGTSVALSDAKNTWFFGVGPFQRGSIYRGTHFAGDDFAMPWKRRPPLEAPEDEIAFHGERAYTESGTDGPETAVADPPASSEVHMADHQESVKDGGLAQTAGN